MLDPPQTLQAFFLLAASTILFLNCIPVVREHLIAYGPRTAAPAKPSESGTKKPKSPRTSADAIIESIASFKIPHAYFNQFYIVSVASSLFWAIQYLTNGKLLRRMSAAVVSSNTDPSMSMEQIELTWALMSIQGLRRQVETSMFAKPTASTMWIGHYLLGIGFYLAMGIAVWIEGAKTLSQQDPSTIPLLLLKPATISAPSWRTVLTLPLFILASGIQHDCHAYLASLPKYSLPAIFTWFVCPHYAAENLIYLSLALIAAPEGQWVNTTLFTAFVFVVVNLSVTAWGVRKWYVGKFGEDAVRGRWILVPFVW